MTQPIITWMDATHSKEIVAPFDYGVIDADTKSEIRIFNVWNNKGGATDVSKMEDCTFTTRDMNGGTGDTVKYDIEAVKNNWFHVQVDSLGENDLDEESSRVGKDFSKPIGTTGKTTVDHSGTPYATPLVPGAKEILGVNNNGNQQDAAGNYVTLSIQCEVPLNARSGKQEFKKRISYRYV
ncbi:hypothetical protein E2R58_01715 [Paenibacillus amylolyticus]|uniref:hypothetical protein n=1 Tax=Paenibacillus amylolyticus TaxID=1451 RepID=UPI00105A7CE5|nr:hypothetical protein [Paenibacillus amylolyticus]TDL67962.1 hypothetical protein E2R58_01715 [Paenibacillus amylolyticus]